MDSDCTKFKDTFFIVFLHFKAVGHNCLRKFGHQKVSQKVTGNTRPFYMKFYNGVDKNFQHHFIIKDIMIVMKTFIR